MEIQKDTEVSLDLSSQLVSMMTTEHYNLQSGRSMSLSEITARASLYLSTVSSTLVALAFVGQIAHLGTAFFVFCLVLFPSLLFIGSVTYERVLQASIEDTVYARGINRIRHLYLEYAPQMKPYFILSSHDDTSGMITSAAVRSQWWQSFLTASGMIAVINSIIAGTFAGLAFFAFFLYAFYTFSQQPPVLFLCTAIGIVAFLISIVLHQQYQTVQWKQADRNIPVLFPTTSDK